MKHVIALALLSTALLSSCSNTPTPEAPTASTATLRAAGFGLPLPDPYCITTPDSPETRASFAPTSISIDTQYLPQYPNTNVQVTAVAGVNTRLRLVVPFGLTADWTTKTVTGSVLTPLKISASPTTPAGTYYVDLWYTLRDGHECTSQVLPVRVTNGGQGSTSPVEPPAEY